MYKDEKKLMVLVNKNAKDMPIQGGGIISIGGDVSVDLVPKIIKRR